MKSVDEIELSIQKAYRKYIWAPFIKAIKDFELLEPNDTIAIAISGGKDSLLMAKLFQILHKHSNIPFTPIFLSMDPGFNADNKENLLTNCKDLGIPLHYFESDIFQVVDKVSKDSPCYMCARMRRGFLYSKAQELGCNKLALGHHFDDVIETTLLNVLYAGNFKTMVPKLRSANFDNLELIRPLYYIKETSIKSFIAKNKIIAMDCGCSVAALKTSSKRHEIKQLIASLKENNSNIDKSIFQSAMNINLDAALGYEKDGIKYDFLDIYNQ